MAGSINQESITSNRPVIFGEVLFDQFPDGTAVLGGAPFNVAWHLQGFGRSPLFLSRIGKDEPGAAIRDSMIEWGMDVGGLQTDTGYPTGMVEVRMAESTHSFHILPDQAYDHWDIDQCPLEAIQKASLLYHGTLVQRSETMRRSLEQLLSAVDLPVFVDLNLREPWWTVAEMPRYMQHARWAKLNDEEMETVGRGLNFGTTELKSAARQLQAEYQLDAVIVTRGEVGAFCLDKATDEFIEVKPQGTDGVLDTVGAGDAFAAVFLLGLLDEWPLTLAMHRAQAFAELICRQRGATKADKQLYQNVLKQWSGHQGTPQTS